MQSTIIVQSLGFTNNKTDKILEFKNRGIKAAAGTVKIMMYVTPSLDSPPLESHIHR